MSPEHRPHVDPSDDCWCRGPWAHNPFSGSGGVADSAALKWITELADGTLINHRGEIVRATVDTCEECGAKLDPDDGVCGECLTPIDVDDMEPEMQDEYWGYNTD